MPKIIKEPLRVKSTGNKPKIIDEFVGRLNTGTTGISIARMKSPPGWIEPPQTPEFDEYTIVINGSVTAKTGDTEFLVRAGEILHVEKGETIQYSTPVEGAEYIAICVPAFSPETVHRDGE